jgi:hypothetical protein
MSDSEFRTLVSFNRNFSDNGLTEKRLKDEFKSFFSNDESNNMFIDSCSMRDLQDLCKCLELYISYYQDTDLRELGIGKYVHGMEKYFMFTTTDVIKNISGNVVSLNESIAAFYQIRNADTDKRNIKPFYDSTITNKRERCEKGNRPGRVAEDMFRKMFNNEDNIDESATIMTCKSRVRILFNRYNKAISEEEKIEIQKQLKTLTREIEESYRTEDEEEISFAQKLGETEDVKVYNGGIDNPDFDDSDDDELEREDMREYDKGHLLRDIIRISKQRQKENEDAMEKREQMTFSKTKKDDDEQEL